MWRRWLLCEFLEEENGQDLVEYALLLSFLSLVCLALLSNVGTGMTTLWNGIADTVSNVIVALH